jgi:hypothetical protein
LGEFQCEIGRLVVQWEIRTNHFDCFGLQDLWLRAGIAMAVASLDTAAPIARLHFSTHESTCTRLYWCQHVLRRYLDGRPSARRARGAYNARPDPTLRFIS